MNPPTTPNFWHVREGDEIEFQVRSSAESDAPMIRARVHLVDAINGSPFVLTDDGFYMLSDFRQFRNLTLGDPR